MDDSLSDEIIQKTIPPENPIPQAEERWLCPFFGTIVGTICSQLDVDRSSKILGPDAPVVYALEEGFMPNDRSWIRFVQTERTTAKAKVLYRPRIVHALVEQIEYLLQQKEEQGIVIQGPQGVGKSYSLINLTRHLLSSGKYLVTFIPNCKKWEDEDDFFQFLLESVGVDPDLFALEYDERRDKKCRKLIHDIDLLLCRKKMQWVFVFDQSNAIFAREQFLNTQDITHLPWPFSMMHRVMKPFRVISIITASANNDVSYRENHPGFKVFDHPIQLDKSEIEMLYPSEEQQQESWLTKWDMLEYATGRVPWYLQQWANDNIRYSGIVRSEIEASLTKLQREQKEDWKCFVSSAIRCLLRLGWVEKPPKYFDRKYSLVHEELVDEETCVYTIETLFPLVETEYRDYFWEDLMKYISTNERYLSLVGSYESTSPSVRSQLFEQIVMGRLYSNNNGFLLKDFQKIMSDANISMDENFSAALEGGVVVVERFDGRSYPELGPPENEILLLIPKKVPNYPAVDLFFRIGNVVIALQIHISESPTNVLLPLLQSNVKATKWENDGIRTVILIYLSPTAGTKDAFMKKFEKKQQSNTASSSILPPAKEESSITYVTLFYSVQDFDRLATIRWHSRVTTGKRRRNPPA